MVPVAPARAKGKLINTSGCKVVTYVKNAGTSVAWAARSVFRCISLPSANRPIVARVGKHILCLPQPAMCHLPFERKLTGLEAARPYVSLYIYFAEVRQLADARQISSDRVDGAGCGT